MPGRLNAGTTDPSPPLEPHYEADPEYLEFLQSEMTRVQAQQATAVVSPTDDTHYALYKPQGAGGDPPVPVPVADPRPLAPLPVGRSARAMVAWGLLLGVVWASSVWLAVQVVLAYGIR